MEIGLTTRWLIDGSCQEIEQREGVMNNYPKINEKLGILVKLFGGLDQVAIDAELNTKTLKSWIKDGDPRPKEFKRFFDKVCESQGITLNDLELPFYDFCTKMSEVFHKDLKDILPVEYEDQTGILLKTRQLGCARETVEKIYDKIKGVWAGIHYWAEKWQDVEPIVNCFVLDFNGYDRTCNNIKFEIKTKSGRPYNGWMFISGANYSFIFECSNSIDTDIVMVSCSRTDDYSLMCGIIVGGIPAKDGLSSRPAASKIIMKKLNQDVQLEEAANLYAGHFSSVSEMSTVLPGVSELSALIENKIVIDILLNLPWKNENRLFKS